MPATLLPLRRGRFSIPDRSRADHGDAARDRGDLVVAAGAVGARALADELGEARAEGAQRGAADLEADLGHRQVAAPQAARKLRWKWPGDIRATRASAGTSSGRA